MAQLNFKASAIQIADRATPTYGPLPAGDYEMMIVRSDTKPTKAGTGSYLELEMHVISGEKSGRRHWERLNLQNPNAQAEKIAKESLARLMTALGLDDINDSEELHDQAFIAEVGIDKKDDTRNVIWNYKPIDAAPMPVKAAPVKSAAPAASAAPAKSARPWG